MTGELHIQGVPISRIADAHGTPLYLYDADVLEATYRRLRQRLCDAVHIFYSLKANPNLSVCALLRALGAGAEVSSLAELVTAQRAGVAPEDIIFLGPGKTREELDACLRGGIHAVVCESLDELSALDEMATSPVRALLRINPPFETKGLRLAMSGKPRQFGIDFELLRTSGARLAALRRVRISGVHVYMGTRILDHRDVVNYTRLILAAAETLSDELGFPLDTVDIGGGLGVAYFDNEEDLDLEQFTAEVNDVVAAFRERRPGCRLIMELGRFLTAPAGRYVVQVLYVKQSMGEQFVVADGGTNHHMAAVGIGSFVKRNFPIRSLTRYHELATELYTICGPLCTPNDVIGKRVALPAVAPGDLLGVERSGAYGPTASPVLFLSHGYPAEVLVHDGNPHLVRRRDTVEDLLASQQLLRF